MAQRPENCHRLRRARLSEVLADRKLDCLVITSLANVRYLSGFTGSNGVLTVAQDRAVLFTDPRYGIQASEQTDCTVRIARGPLIPAVAGWLKTTRCRVAGFERSHINYDCWKRLEDGLPVKTVLKPAAGLVEGLRMVKSAEEIALIRRSMQTATRAFERTIRRVRPGLTELDLAAELDHRMRKLGAEQPAFETIVASGPRSALPHAQPTERRLASGDLLLIDMGALQDGYASDMTRMCFLGEPQATVRQMYDAVQEAQQAALDAARDGVPAAAVDRAARRVLRDRGLDRHFVHSTGHGLGLEIHEAPRLGKGERSVLRAGMAVTIEPGVYLQGFGGVRIEDTVVITPTGCEVLTGASKELLLL